MSSSTMDPALLGRYSSSSDWFESLSTPTRTRQSRLDTSDAIPAFYPFAARQSGGTSPYLAPYNVPSNDSLTAQYNQNMFPLDNDSQVFPRINGDSEDPPLQYDHYHGNNIASPRSMYSNSHQDTIVYPPLDNGGNVPLIPPRLPQTSTLQGSARKEQIMSEQVQFATSSSGVEMPSSFNFSTSSPYGLDQTRYDARPYAPEPRHDPNVGRPPGAGSSFPPHAAPVSEIQTQLRHPRVRGRAQAVIQRRRTGPASYNCLVCGPAVDFTTAAALKTHFESSHLGRVFLCEKCPKTFAHPSSRARHQRKCTGNASLLIVI